MASSDCTDVRRRAQAELPCRLATLIDRVLDEKDQRIQELLTSNQELRARAQRAETQLALTNRLK